MSRFPLIRDFPPFLKLVSLLIIVISSFLFVMLFGLLFAMPFYGTDVLNLIAETTDYSNPRNVSLLKYFQVVNQLGVFVLPAILFVYFTGDRFTDYMKLNNLPKGSTVIITLLLIFTVLPFINWLADINNNIVFADCLAGMEEWFRSMEDEAEKLTKAFLSTTSVGGLLVNLMIIAFLAAVGEEFIFRGIILRLFREWTGSKHFAVIVSAILFSVLHLQFFGFLPRFVLGLVLGYLFVYTSSLWTPIIFHFFNNGMAVMVAFLDARGRIEFDYESFGSTELSWIILASFLLSFGLLILVRRFGKKEHA